MLLLWVVEGFAGGWLAGKFMASEGRDQVMDIVMGIAGAIAAGFLFNASHILVQGKMIYTSLVAAAGAVMITVISQYVGGRREYGSTD